jgi:hypothetical protein
MFAIRRAQKLFLKNRMSSPTMTTTIARTYKTMIACLPPIVLFYNATPEEDKSRCYFCGVNDVVQVLLLFPEVTVTSTFTGFPGVALATA